MHFRFPLGWMCLCITLFAVSTTFAENVDRYREFQLGSSSASVLSLTGTTVAELKTVHARPALLQELAWRPRYGARRAIPDVDPVREIVFSFYNDQLYRIAVEYDQYRTAGMTEADVIEALTALYGPQATSPLPRTRQSLSTTVVPIRVAQWRDEDASAALSKSVYGSAFSLLVSSVSLNELARTANTAGVAMHAREAPAREAARAKQQADDAKAAEEKARATNKGTFRP